MDERPCRSCNEPLRFERTPNGRLAPINIRTGLSHFADCPQRDAWRKPPPRQPSLFDDGEPGTEATPAPSPYPD